MKRTKTIAGLLLLAMAVCCIAVTMNREDSIAEPSHEPDRSSVTAIPRAKILEVSHRIDQLVEDGLAAEGETSGPRVSDHTFLRRLYLDIAGRIPNLDETRAFLDSKDENKRVQLIDDLLDSDAYVSHQFNVRADLLRYQSRNRIGPNRPYKDFIKSSISNNVPYDKFVRDMVTASGPLMKRGNGAVGYLMRDFGMPEDNMSNTIRVFLGTRLECAQCHDHPTADWTQRQYFEMVAFMGGVHHQIRNSESPYDEEVMDLLSDPELSAPMKTAIRQMAVPLHYGVYGAGTGVARLPEGYTYKDGKEYDVVNARTIFNGQELINPSIPEDVPHPMEGMNPQAIRHNVAGAYQIGSRETFAQWLTAKDNWRFPSVTVNRLWKQAMGEGIVPAGSFDAIQQESQPELIRFLSKSFVDLQFDTKQVLRAIYMSDAYQRKSLPTANDRQCSTGNGPAFRRMSAEQIWDSLLTLAIDDVDKEGPSQSEVPNFLGLTDIHDSYDEIVQLDAAELKELAAKTIEPDGPGSKGQPQFIFRIDGKPAIFRMDSIHAGMKEELLRASELMSPMPPGHLLREFGQSDREEVDNGNKEISMTQLLSLMNGFVEDRVTGNRASVLMRNILESGPREQQIETAFLSVLGRYPTDAEQEIWIADFENYGEQTASDLVWTLVNSTEFLFIQ